MMGIFSDILAGRGDAVALVDDEGHVTTYADLSARVDAFARRLPVDKVLLALEMAPSVHAVTALLAAWRAGHAVALLPAGCSSAREAFTAAYQPEVVYRPVDGRWRLEEARGEAAVSPIHPDLALMLLTSGSTGAGKAVRLSAAAVRANASQIAASLALTAEDRAALTLPLHYAYGLSVLTSHLVAGASVWLSRASVLDPGFAGMMAARAPTNFPGVPFSFQLLHSGGIADGLPPSLRLMTVAGGRLPADEVRVWAGRMAARGGRFAVMYGQSEATARISLVPPERLAGAEDCIGLPVPGGRFILEDEAGREIITSDSEGELVYRGPNVMMGYATGRADLARGAEITALRTGDIALRRPDGLYQFRGRRSRFSKIAGLRIGHDALEAALAREGYTVAVTGDDTGIAAFVEGEPGERLLGRLVALSGLSRTHLVLETLPALPRLASGKIDYPALKARRAAQPAPLPRADLAALFRQSFYPHAIRESDSFQSLGGDSLRHVEISVGLERALGHIPEGWESLSIARLAALRPEKRSNASIGSDLFIRALAILFVVTQHATLWPIPGGSSAMVVLIGYALARFQRQTLIEGDYRRFFRPLLRVGLPYLVILAGYGLAWAQVPWASVFLVGNVGVADPVRRSMLPYLYWFVEAYAQMLILVALVFLLPKVRAMAQSRPFELGLAMIAVTLAARFATPWLWDIGNRKIFTLPWILPLAAFGWTAAVATTREQKAVLAGLALATMPVLALQGGNWTGSWVKYGLQAAIVVALLHAPAVRLPAPLRRLVLPVALASFHIYLFHRFVPELLLLPVKTAMPPALFTATAIVGGVALGIATHALQQRLTAALARRAPAREAAPLRDVLARS